MTPVLAKEIKRKFFHGLSFAYMGVFAAAGRPAALWILGLLLAAVATLEAVRLRYSPLNAKLLSVFGGIHRDTEVRGPSGIFWTLAGCFLTIVFVREKDIALTALGFLALGDGAAGLVGGRMGHLRMGRKSLEGSLACFLACWFVGTVFLYPSFGVPEVLLGAFAATLVEALPLPFNDNLWTPLLSGIFMSYVRYQGSGAGWEAIFR